MGYELNLDNPETIYEKLQWLKLYNRKPEYTMMVDKYRVKDWVSSKIGEEHVITLYGAWDTYDDSDWNSLPNEFVLKCNHDGGSGLQG